MAKKKTSKKQSFCFDNMPIHRLKKNKSVKQARPKAAFKNKKDVALALFLCLEKNDIESFVEILGVYLDINKSQIAEKSNLARSTVNNVFSKNGNPTLRTLAQVIHESVA